MSDCELYLRNGEFDIHLHPKFCYIIASCDDFPISSHLSLSCPLFYHHLRTQSSAILRTLSMPWSWVNTEYSIHRVLHTLCTAYIEYSIHQIQEIQGTACTRYSIQGEKHTPSTAYPECSINPWSTFWFSQPVSHMGTHKGRSCPSLATFP